MSEKTQKTLKNVDLLNKISNLGLDINDFRTLNLREGQATLTSIYSQSLALRISSRMGKHTESDPSENAYIKFENEFLTIYLYL